MGSDQSMPATITGTVKIANNQLIDSSELPAAQQLKVRILVSLQFVTFILHFLVL